jgi:hypothetical protein
MGTAWRTGAKPSSTARHALGGRIGRAQLGMRGLQRLQLAGTAGRTRRRDLGRVQHVVAVRGAVAAAARSSARGGGVGNSCGDFGQPAGLPGAGFS